MIFRLKTKLTMIFVFISTLIIIFTGLFSRAMLESNFKDYVMQKQENSNKAIVSSISQQYTDDKVLNVDFIENIGMKALEQGQILKVTDLSGKTVWDATTHNNGMCQRMIEHIADNMTSKYPSFDGKYTVSSYTINSNSKDVGRVEIGYYGPFYFNDEDLHFINTLNTSLLWVALFGVIISLLLGHVFSKKLSDPIARVINTAKRIEQGNYTTKVIGKTTTKEINELESTMNNLSETLQKQEDLRKRLTADVAHELRTPLATLQGHMEAMIDGIWQPTNERLTSCFDEIIRIEKMVGDLQLLTKYESEVAELYKTEFELADLVKNVIMNFESQFVNKGVGIFATGKATLFADKDKISQVIINILSNALKYTNTGGRVDIITKENENEIAMTIKDNGCGINKDDLPYIFERFYRADKSRNRLTGGAGIGLSIVKAIIDMHHGSIYVESKENEGTAFEIILQKKQF
jgi:signal transduction histidine kinase